MSKPTSSSSLTSVSEVRERYRHLVTASENLQNEIRQDNIRISSGSLSAEEKQRLKTKGKDDVYLLQCYEKELAQIRNEYIELKGKKEKQDQQDMPPPPPPPKKSH